MPNLGTPELQEYRATLSETTTCGVRVPTAPAPCCGQSPSTGPGPCWGRGGCTHGKSVSTPVPPHTQVWAPRKQTPGLRWPPAGPQAPPCHHPQQPPAPAARAPHSSGYRVDPMPSDRTNQEDCGVGGGEESGLGGETRGKSPGPISPNFPLISNFFFLRNFFITDFRTHHPWQLTQQVLAKANVSLLVWGEEVIPDRAQGTGSPGPAQGPDGKDGVLAQPQSLVLLVTRKSADGTGRPGG